MSWPITGWSVRKVRVASVVLLVCATALTAAAAPGSAFAASVRKSTTKTFTLPAATTRTFDVGYPSALKFAGASYSCTAKVLGLGAHFVTILSRGSALGGTVCRVKARNRAQLPSLDTTARIRVSASTTYSSAAKIRRRRGGLG